MIRQRDTWVLDVYLNEAGWDGQHVQYYFATLRDATTVEDALVKRAEKLGGDYWFEHEVYKVTPPTPGDTDVNVVAKAIGDEIFLDIEWVRKNA